MFYMCSKCKLMQNELKKNWVNSENDESTMHRTEQQKKNTKLTDFTFSESGLIWAQDLFLSV